MSAINTNMSSILARNALVSNERNMSTSMERLSTGIRINSSKDDAAGLAISSKMTSQIRGLDQAVRNANDAVSLIQTAEGALVETTNMLQRMRELAVQSASDTNVTADRSALNQEFQQLKAEINRIGSNTQWNGSNIIDQSFSSSTGTYKFQVGANAAQTIDLTIGNYGTGSAAVGTAAVATTTANAAAIAAPHTVVAAAAQVSTITIAGAYAEGNVISGKVGTTNFSYTVKASDIGTKTVDAIAAGINTALGTVPGVTLAVSAGVITATAAVAGTGFDIETKVSGAGLLNNINGSVITSQTDSNTAITQLDTAIATVNTGRAEMGATMNRLEYAADNLAKISANATESRGRILDADYAKETTELARTQIIAQAGTAMLAQANQVKQTVLSLLK